MNKIIIFLSLIFISNCAGTRIQYLKPDEFIKEANEYAFSADWTTYVGASATRVYLEHGHVITLSGNPRVVIYWTEKNELPKTFMQNLNGNKQKRQKLYKENQNDGIDKIIKPGR